ncbi:hypothetical protein OG792_14490 [Micromonospora sp. NBC_01699]|uniref:restriction system modified-DNA reader domain-containing protein n=1 Tax=Micromonospora sp. NBC_01699 TaxID=2975984 RepID=UPI002E360D9C|nr:hypothetical protein [Micromonospora sp. NBC_01699]
MPVALPTARTRRNAYLLEGRRVRLADILAGGLIEPGTTLRFDRPRVGDVHRATITENGWVRLEDGQEFRSPSRAAAVAAGIRAVDGWFAWRVDSSQRALDSYRQELLEQAATEPTTRDGDNAEAILATRIHDQLRKWRTRADARNPERIRVRELLSLWGARDRGDHISRIEADLANHGLATFPSFRSVTLDAAVDVVSDALEENEPASMIVSPAPDEPDEADVGFTVGNLPSALDGVVAVPPTASFDVAITAMLLNDFSQLAVMVGAHSLRGAVTWQSIAQAQHRDPTAGFSGAIVPAHEVRYDQELTEILPTLERSDFVFVRDAKNAISGIVTTADVAHEYGRLSTPFLRIGELDRMLRRVLARTFELAEVVALCDPQGRRTIVSFDDLSMGDYERVLENPDSWAKLCWPLDRVTFIKRLQEIRKIRNDVMHFNPDPLPPDTVEKLGNILRLLRRYQE